MGQLDNKTAIVTGSSRGIGAEVAKILAGEGAAVVVKLPPEGAARQQGGGRD